MTTATLQIRPTHGRLDARALASLADIADEFADGRIMLTPRMKLLLRNVHDEQAANAALAKAGLTESAEYAGLPDRTISPATDLDPHANARIDALIQAIDTRLNAAGLAGRFGGMFAIAVDGGGTAHIGNSRAHIRLDKLPGRDDHWRVSLIGTVTNATVLGTVTEADAPAVVCRIAERFVDADHNFRRLRQLPADEIRQRFGGCGETPTAPQHCALERSSEPLFGPQDDNWQVAGFVFGRVDSQALRVLAKLADATATGDIRLTPYRSIILARGDDEARQALRETGAIVDTHDKRLAMTACIGIEGCTLGTTYTRDDALECLPAIPHLRAASQDMALHVSGCAKGCARSAPAAITLVGRKETYNVVFAGGPTDMPTWRALPLEEVMRRLQHLDQAFARDGVAGESAENFFRRLGTDGINHAAAAVEATA